MPSDVFRPRLPLDPFAALDTPPPWRIPVPDTPPPLPHVVLLLGAPTLTDLAPLATSSHLVHSLLIIATHTPPPVPPLSHASGPAIIILHLHAQLDIHDSGAIRLVSLLDRAQRVAHAWRTTAQPQPRLQQLAELYPGGEFAVSEEPELAPNPPPVPRRSSSSPLSSDEDDSSSSVHSSSTSSRSSLKLSPKSKNSAKQIQGRFTALINFLPPALPDKALLKHAILVTTLSAPFLTAPSTSPSFSPYQKGAPNKRRSIFSTLSLSSLSSHTQHSPRRSRLSSLFSSDPPGTPLSSPPSLFATSRTPSVESLFLTSTRHPHLVHVLPYSASHAQHDLSTSSSLSTLVPTPQPLPPHAHRTTTAPVHLLPMNKLGRGPRQKSKLVQSIEQFLLSFAYPPAASASSPALSPAAATPARQPLRSSPLAPSQSGSEDGGIQAERRMPLPIPLPVPVPVPVFTTNVQQQKGHAVPYLVPAGVLGATPAQTQSDNAMATALCVGELVLLGVLDGVATGRGGEGVQEAWPRAWVGAAGEVEVGGVQSTSEGGGGKKRKGGRKRVRRNEAGLPTPPESSSSLDGEWSEDEDEEGQDVREEREMGRVYPGKHLPLPPARAHMHAERRAPVQVQLAEDREGEKRKLRARMSRFFGHGEVYGVSAENLTEKRGEREREMGTLGRLRRAWTKV